MSAYDEIAEWYDEWVGTHTMDEDTYFPAVEALMGEVAGKHICDLACGQGRVARHLADRGASVVGIDNSARLLAIARRHEEAKPRGIVYRQADARDLAGVENGTFDGVLCHMALMDIPDLAPTLRAVARILRPSGTSEEDLSSMICPNEGKWFVFSILHPCFHTAHSGEMALPEGAVRTVGRYFVEGHWRDAARTGPPGTVGAYHRTLSTYLNALMDAGLTLERMSEPGAPDGAVVSPSQAGALRPVWREVPAILVARCRTIGTDHSA